MGEQELVEVYRAKDGPQAYLLKSALEEEGLRAVVVGETLQGTIAPGWRTAPQVMVESQDKTRARQIVARFEGSSSAASPEPADGSSFCLACGTRMGPEEEVCAACGWSHREGEGDA